MRCKGHRLVGLPGSLQGRETCCFLVSFLDSVFCLLLLTLSYFSSQCAGGTPGGQDFEAFIGAEKAKEFKTLFTSWIHTIYRAF